MGKIVSNSVSEGNTSSSETKKQVEAKTRWCFTLNNYTQKEYDELNSALSVKTTRYVMGKEVGDSGTPHLQGYYETSSRTRPTCLKLSHKRTHFEIAKGSDVQNYVYCTKEGDYVEKGFDRRWKLMNKLIEIKTIKREEFFDWQNKVYAIWEEFKKKPEDRLIHWIYSENGCNGKTALARYLVKNDDFGYLNNAKTSDICFYASNNMKDGYVFDFCRSNEDKINYQAIESLKNGIMFSGKYESNCILMDSPCIICFANFEPDTRKLSKDRWNIINLDEVPEAPSDVSVNHSYGVEVNTSDSFSPRERVETDCSRSVRPLHDPFTLFGF